MRRMLAALLCVAVAANAQEGFPLDGTWRAELAAAGDTPTTIVLVMQWDGTHVTGTINPGPDGVDFQDAQLQPEGWKVILATQDAKGAEHPVRRRAVRSGQVQPCHFRTVEAGWQDPGHPLRA